MAYMIKLDTSIAPSTVRALHMPPKDANFQNPDQPVDPESMPKEAKMITSHKKLNDYFTVLSTEKDRDQGAAYGYAVLSERFRDLIEEYEQGVHDFFELKIYERKKRDPQLLEEKYFILDIRRTLDRRIFDFERSGEWLIHAVRDDGTEWTSLGRMSLPGSAIYMNPDFIKGHHLWVSGINMSGHAFVSQELGDEIKKQKFKGARLRHFPE